MSYRIKILWEEINYYRNQNKDLEVEDLLGKKKGQQPRNEKKIKENEERIDKLFEAMMDF